jgi:hypothetical protein
MNPWAWNPQCRSIWPAFLATPEGWVDWRPWLPWKVLFRREESVDQD